MATEMLDIINISLLTVDEYERLYMNIPVIKDPYWLYDEGTYDEYAFAVITENKGANGAKGDIQTVIDVDINNKFGVRPILEISNLNETGYKIGDEFKFGDQIFTIIADNEERSDYFVALAISKDIITSIPFDKETNDYAFSHIKEYIDNWYDKCNYIDLDYGDI